MTSRVESLDMVRGIAAFAVASSHFFVYRMPASRAPEIFSVLAVEIFFVLSGFVLAPQLIACAYARDDRVQGYGLFLARRWMRTVPPYLVALACMSITVQQLNWTDAARYALYLQNLFHQSNIVDYYPVAWSLSVEEWFYITFPLFLFGVIAVVSRCNIRIIAGAAASYILIVTLLRAGLGDAAHWGYEVRRVVVFRVDSIAYGVLLYIGVRFVLEGRGEKGARGCPWRLRPSDVF